MPKKLIDMSGEELRELFPIILKGYNPEYKQWYETEKVNLLTNLDSKRIVRINHIGSTSVEGLIAKPTVDILLEVENLYSESEITSELTSLGWILMSHEDNSKKLVFNKGYTPTGFSKEVYHLHVRNFGDWNELYFRDYLIKHRDIADKYAKLKLSLYKKYEYDRDGYTAAKSEFILKYTALAREEFPNRYADR